MNPLPVPSVQFPVWVSYIQALGPTAVALIAAAIAAGITWFIQTKQIEVARGVKEIAHNQFINAQTKLRLDLFQARFKTLQDIGSYIDEVLKGSNIDENFDAFRNCCAPVEYLFDRDVYNFLEQDVIPLIREFNLSNTLLDATHEDDASYDYFNSARLGNQMQLFAVHRKLQERMGPFLKVER